MNESPWPPFRLRWALQACAQVPSARALRCGRVPWRWLPVHTGLALSVFGHFLAAMWWRRRGVLGGRRSHRLHLSVFCHVLAIVLLAKAMFYLHW